MRIVPLAAAALLLAASSGCGSDDKEAAPKESALSKAATACVNSVEYAEWPFEDYVVLGDNDMTATITHPSTGDIEKLESFDQIAAMKCFLGELEVTDAIESQMGQTTSMMGRQEAEWSGFEISWSYHPDSGLAAVVTEAPQGD